MKVRWREGAGRRCRRTMEMFKNLIVWQKAMELVKAAYALSKRFPSDERYALTDQLVVPWCLFRRISPRVMVGL